MLKSMTGFGAGKAEDEAYCVVITVKAVNQRFLDIDLRMPPNLDPLSEAMKRKIREYVTRGKLWVNVQVTDKRGLSPVIKVDKILARTYHAALQELSDALQVPRTITITEIAGYSGILEVGGVEDDMDSVRLETLQALDEAMRQLTAMREAEGKNLQADFVKRLMVLENYMEKLSALAPTIVENYRARLQKTLGELLDAANIDQTRIIQETAIYADRINYTEEIVRLCSHLKQFRHFLAKEQEPVGRKLDFLVQEMNREINTVSSKANHVDATLLAVEIKSEIEKMREQVQNIE